MNAPRSEDTVPSYALLALGLGAVGIGFSPIFVRLSDVDPVASAFFRTALAVPLLWLWPFLFQTESTKKQAANRQPSSLLDYALLLLSGAFFAGDLGFWHISIGLTSVANATLFPNMAPVYVTFAAWAFFGERITQRFLVGLVLAIAGAVTILGDSLWQAKGHIAGDLLASLAALFYAAYLVMVARLRRRFSALTIMVWSSLGTTLVLLPVCLMTAERLLPAGLSGWMVLLGLSWFSHVGGQGLIAYALAHLPMSFSSVGLLVQPILAALFAWLVFFEPLGVWQAIGAIIILAGIYLARQATMR